MTDDTSSTDFEALDALLEAERAALLEGDLVSLTEMLPSKEALIDALNQSDDMDLTALQQLDGKVRRNQLLLDGALEGIRKVANRMAALRRMRAGLDIYGLDVRRQRIDVKVVHPVERRA